MPFSLLPAAFGIAVAIAGIQPRWMPVALALLGIVVLVCSLAYARSPRALASAAAEPILTPGPLTGALMLLALYAGISIAWSLLPGQAAAKVAWLVVVVLVANIAIGLAGRLEVQIGRAICIAVVVGFAIAAMLVTFEVWTKQALMRAILNWIPGLRGDTGKHLILDKDRVIYIGAYVLNRNAGALSLLLWPTLLAASALPGRTLRGAVPVVLLVLAAAGVAFSQHESSQLAVAAGLAVFLLARLWLPAGRGIVLTGWVAAVVLMLPLVVGAYRIGLSEAAYLPRSAQARIILWNFTASEYLKRPALGVGAYSTRAIDDAAKPKVPTIDIQDKAFQQRTGQHGHNVYLQTWFELGAVGALLLLACGLAAWRAIVRLSEAAQPYALAAFTSAMVIGSFTWGLWQEWYLSLFALSAIVTGLAARFGFTEDR